MVYSSKMGNMSATSEKLSSSVRINAFGNEMGLHLHELLVTGKVFIFYFYVYDLSSTRDFLDIGEHGELRLLTSASTNV